MTEPNTLDRETAQISLHELSSSPAPMLAVLAEVAAERALQEAKWGQQNHPDAPTGIPFPSAFFGVLTEEAAKKHCEEAFRRGGGSYAHIFVEEVAEAITAVHKPELLREELVQCAAVAIAWIECMDRRGHQPKRVNDNTKAKGVAA